MRRTITRKPEFVGKVKSLYRQAESGHWTSDRLSANYKTDVYDHPHYARLTIADKEYIRGFRDALDGALWDKLQWRLGSIDGPLPIGVDGWKLSTCCVTAAKLHATKCPICYRDLRDGASCTLGDLSRLPGALFGGHFWTGTDDVFTTYKPINRPRCVVCHCDDSKHNPITGVCEDIHCRRCTGFDAGWQFPNWLAVKHYCETHAWIYYHAPLDRHPVVVAVRRVFKNGKIRVAGPGLTFTIDKGHLDRLSHSE